MRNSLFIEEIFEKISDGILVIGNTNEIEFCNNKLLTMLGYSENEANKIKISDIFGGINLLGELNKKNLNFNLKMRTKNNKSIGVILQPNIGQWNNKDAIICVVREYEKVTKKDLENFFENAPFMCAIKNRDGEYLHVNKAARRSLRLSEDDFVGKKNCDIFAKNGQDVALQEDIEVLKTGKIVPYQKYVQKEDGYVQWLEGCKIPVFDDRGEVKHIAKVATDITLRKKIEQDFIDKHSYLYSVDSILDRDSYEIDSYSKLDTLQNNFLSQLGADGINVWLYNDKKQELISEFRDGICEELTIENGMSIKMNRDEFYSNMVNFNKEGVFPVDERVTGYKKDRAHEIGIKYQGIYKVHFNGEFFGVISVLYKEYDEKDFNYTEVVKKICEQIGMLVKNQTLSNGLKKEFKKRKEVENELEEFLDTAMDLMAVINEDGHIVKINKEASNIFGWSKEELLKKRWQDMIHKDDLKATEEAVCNSKVNYNIVQNIVNRYINKEGQIVWLDWGYKYLKDKKILMCTAKNITENKKMEKDRADYERALHLESVKNEFFSNISHEFKTPLNIILATMQLINKSIENNQIRVLGDIDLNRYMKSIGQNSYRLLRLVNNLIDITRIDTGFYRLNLENNNIISVIEDITTSVAQYIENKGIALVFDTDIEEVIIACDPDKIERVMLNLLSNAIKYTDLNGEINVNISTTNKEVIVSVRDNGIGIPKEKLGTIFDRFIQVDNTLTRKCEGSGIGLSLVKSLVELHGGTIEAKSEEGNGTEFVFRLPARLVDNQVKISENTLNSKVEKCNIEFSDIYRL